MKLPHNGIPHWYGKISNIHSFKKRTYLFLGGRGRETSPYLCIHWLTSVSAFTRDWTCHLGVSDDTTKWPTWQSPQHIFFLKNIYGWKYYVCPPFSPYWPLLASPHHSGFIFTIFPLMNFLGFLGLLLLCFHLFDLFYMRYGKMVVNVYT